MQIEKRNDANIDEVIEELCARDEIKDTCSVACAIANL